jgi:8-oxo-dGTP pyrophosphatase MutT (NUDIX family)
MDRHDAAEVFRLAARVGAARLSGGHTKGGVAVLLNPRGEVLLTLARYRRGWSFPGGYFEPGETGPQGITRELVEEIGYAADGPLIRVVHTSSRPGHSEHFGFALLDQDQADRLHATSWEVRGLRWCGPHSMPRLHSFARSLLSDAEGIVSQHGGRWVVGPRVPETATVGASLALSSPAHEGDAS